MKAYQAKTLLTGYKINLSNPSLYVAIPLKYFYNSRGTKGVFVKYDGETRCFTVDEVKHKQTFPDKFRPGENYTLAYCLWKEIKNEPIEEN